MRTPAFKRAQIYMAAIAGLSGLALAIKVAELGAFEGGRGKGGNHRAKCAFKPFNKSSHTPHQGKKECARRVAKEEGWAAIAPQRKWSVVLRSPVLTSIGADDRELVIAHNYASSRIYTPQKFVKFMHGLDKRFNPLCVVLL